MAFKNLFSRRPARSRFSRFDMWVYRLFFRVWSPHLRDDPGLRRLFIDNLTGFDRQRQKPLGELRLAAKDGELLGEDPKTLPSRR